MIITEFRKHSLLKYPKFAKTDWDANNYSFKRDLHSSVADTRRWFMKPFWKISKLYQENTPNIRLLSEYFPAKFQEKFRIDFTFRRSSAETAHFHKIFTQEN